MAISIPYDLPKGRLAQYPLWIRIPLFALLLPFILIFILPILFFLLCLALLLFPIMFVLDKYHLHQFWRKMAAGNKIRNWNLIRPQLLTGCGTLIIETNFKRAITSCWYIDAAPHMLHPGVVPTWVDFTKLNFYELFRPPKPREVINKWSSSMLLPLAHSAVVLRPISRSDLDVLPLEIQTHCVLVMFSSGENTLSRYWRKQLNIPQRCM